MRRSTSASQARGSTVIQACGHDERIHRCGTLATAIGSGERPGLPTQSHTAESALRYIVAQANSAIIEEAVKTLPALQHIVHGLGDIGVARELRSCRAHPVFQISHERRDPCLSDSAAPISGLAVDLALRREDGVDPAHGVDCERRRAQFRQFKKLATGVGQQTASVTGPGCRTAS